MKEYKVGDHVIFETNDFEGRASVQAWIIKADKDFAIAEELGCPNPMHLYIDEDTDFMFRKEYK